MEQFLKDCLDEAFTSKNLQKIWNFKQSSEDIIDLECNLPIRYKLNEVGTRNVEIRLQSQLGIYYKTIALVENTDLLIPREFDKFSSKYNFQGFKNYGLKSEINVMMGAFSMSSFEYSVKNEDVELYKSNGGDFEMIKAFDGTMQTFVKEKGVGIESWSPFDNLYKSELDGVPVSAFKFYNEQLGVFPTNYTHKWLERLVPQRLMEVFTIEKI